MPYKMTYKEALVMLRVDVDRANEKMYQAGLTLVMMFVRTRDDGKFEIHATYYTKDGKDGQPVEEQIAQGDWRVCYQAAAAYASGVCQAMQRTK